MAPRPPALGEDANRQRRRYLKSRRKPSGRGQVGPDGPRYRGPGFGKLEDPGRGLRGTRKRRENPPPKRGVTFGPRPKGRGRPDRPRRPQRPRPVPPSPFQSEVDALTELQYGGQQRELEAQRHISGQQQANMGHWYYGPSGYLQQTLQAQQQYAAYTAGLQAAAYQQANQAAATDQTQGNQLLAQQQAQAAQRGMTVDPNVAQTMQQGQAARQTAGTQFGGLLAAQGQAQTGYLGNRVAVAGQQGLQAQQDEQRKRAQIDQLARDLQKEMGAFKVKATSDIKEREHTQRLENKAFGLDVAEFQQDTVESLRDDRRQARSDRASRRDRRIDNRRQAAEARERARHNRENERLANERLKDDDDGPGGPGGEPKYTQSQRNANQKAFREGRSFASQLKGFSPKEKIRVLTNKENIDPLIARAVVAPGSLSARQRNELRRMGIKVRGPGRPGPHDIGAKPSPLGPK